MPDHIRAQAPEQSRPVAPPRPATVLQRQPACLCHIGKGRSCGRCNTAAPAQRSAGQSLDARTRADMEARFGFDFTRVRVHTDAEAARSADAVEARAFTVGRDIVFGPGQYAPHGGEGRRLLAHELAHVVQQASGATRAGATATSTEGEAQAASRSGCGQRVRVASSVAPGTIQRDAKNTLDAAAKAIIARAKDPQVAASVRAVALVNDIIATYFPSDAAKVQSVVYDNKGAGSGLQVQSVGSGPSTIGTIFVGDAFLGQVDSFARRVLQVEHELMHIDQYRGGLAGGQNKDKREFLAFSNEALASEKPGTGRMSFSTRLRLIDGALGYFHCLAKADQTALADKKAALLARRSEVNGKAGNEPVPEPTECKRG
jgi:hypothetical protein